MARSVHEAIRWTIRWRCGAGINLGRRFTMHAPRDCVPAASPSSTGGSTTSTAYKVRAPPRSVAACDTEPPGELTSPRSATGSPCGSLPMLAPRSSRPCSPGTNKLSRKAPGETGQEQVLAANLDFLFLVTSLNRDLNPCRLERFLAAAHLPGAQRSSFSPRATSATRPVRSWMNCGPGWATCRSWP